MKDDQKPLDEFGDNLVSFPLKSKVILPTRHEDLDDPLSDLLNEFSHLEDHDFPEDYLFGAEEEQTDDDLLLSQLDLVVAIERKIKSIHEMNKRLRFYLDEVETFIPRGRLKKK